MGKNLHPLALPWDKWLNPGDHILCSHMTSEPRALLTSLGSADLPEHLSLELGVPFSLDAQNLPETVSVQVMGGMGAAGKLARTRKTIIDREEYQRIEQQYASGQRGTDAVLVSLAQDADGRLHLGAAHGPALEAARHAKLVIAEINSAAPVIAGAPWPNDIAITEQVQCNYPIATTQPLDNKPHEIQIAGLLADIIPDGACLQVGIGSLPTAILSSLKAHRNLGIHTGMLGDSLHTLMSLGVVDNSRKPPEYRQTITGSVFGSSQLYAALKTDANVVLAPAAQTHSIGALKTIDHLTTINSAIEVDLSGRVNTETAENQDGSRRYIGGVGGLPAFVRGALASRGGLSIIVMPSLTRFDETSRSRIVKSLRAEVTLDETMADIVVTEFGVARLRGISLAKRKEQLVAIAHPDVRDWLRN